MKKILILAFLFWGAFSGYSQIVLSTGSHIIVNSDSDLIANNITNSGGTITNNGDVSVLGNITNNEPGLFDASSSGTVTFEGGSAQVITGDEDIAFYGTVNIDNSNGVSITDATTGAHQTINGTLNFTSGKLTLNAFNLTIGSTDPTGAGTSSYIVTNGDGQVKRIVAASDVLFPVGNTAYNPITLNNAGTSDTYGVKAIEGKPTSFSGTTHIVNESWDVTEAVADGSNLTVTTQWNSADEATDFDCTKSCVGFTTNGGTDVAWGTIADAGSAPYTRSTTGITSVGTFMVGDYYYGGLFIDLKVFLAAAYNAANDNMDKKLNTAGLLPLTDPYGQNTTVSSIPTDAVDWIKIELRDKNNSATVLHNFARFVDQDGQIIEEDESNFKMTSVASDSYYVAIHHRNHNGVMTTNTIDLTQNSPSFDFKANTNIYGTDSQVGLGNGNYGLRKGNVNNDGRISKVGPPSINDYTALLNVLGANTFLLNTYSNADINMDGSVRKVGPVSINDYSALLNSLGANTIIFEQLP